MTRCILMALWALGGLSAVAAGACYALSHVARCVCIYLSLTTGSIAAISGIPASVVAAAFFRWSAGRAQIAMEWLAVKMESREVRRLEKAAALAAPDRAPNAIVARLQEFADGL